MKYLAAYTKEKFLSFSFDAQLKALNKLIEQLQIDIAVPKSRDAILMQIITLYPLCKQDLPPRYQTLFSSLSDDPFRLLRAIDIFRGSSTLKDNQIFLRTGDGTISPNPDMLQKAGGIVVICDNLRSVFNVGSIFRVCECLAIAKIILCGITPTPNHPNMPKTALGTTEKVPWEHNEDTLLAIIRLKREGYKVYALETAEPSQSVYQCDFSYPLALVVGNESLGIAPSTLSECDAIVHLPVLGWKNSLNVGVATSVALYQIMYGGSSDKQIVI